ncbi:MAG: hypothetical protein H7308_04840 [Chthonomonadaceae bacterium]|nr:hypothetical protein [Chthonomonadaceae bacterium]
MAIPLKKEQTTEAPAPARISETVPALTPRALVVGILCVAVTCVVTCFAELVVKNIQIGFLQLPPVVVGMLTLLLGVQGILGKFSKNLKLRTHELFTIYVMMLMAAMISSRGLLQKLIPLLIVPNYYATPENNWRGLFFSHIPKWAVPFDPTGDPKQNVALRFYEALRFGEPLPWQMWILPLTMWGIFVALMFGAFLCLAVILRRQWVDNEKLSFPLVQLPLEMIKGETVGMRGQIQEGFMRNPLTWLGFAVPAFVFGLNGLHQWYPNFPEIPTAIPLNPYFTARPWNGLDYTAIYVSFAAIGFFYLLPTDLLFSLWFFYFINIFQTVTAINLSYEPEVMPMYGVKQFIGYQIIGCYFVLVGYMMYTARPHLKRVWRAAIGGRKGQAMANDGDELLSYRSAFWGLFACLLLSSAWMSLLGMSYWLALFELSILLFVIALVMARSTSESGMLMTETSFRPIDLYRMVGDVRNLSPANNTGLAFLDAVWMRDQRGLILTGFLDAMKAADGVKVRRKSLLAVFGVGIGVALLVSGFMHVYLPYKFGAVQLYSYVYQMNPVWAFNDSATSINRSRPPLPFYASLNFMIGIIVTVGITIARTRFVWFPLHPLGYALCGTWTMTVFWFACFAAWFLKIIILRYGGMKLFAKARPFFLGMVLGEFTMAIFWTIPSIFYRTPTPSFPWP